MATFRVIPYFARKSISLPNLDKFLDILIHRLQEMEDSNVANPDEEPESRNDEADENSDNGTDRDSESDGTSDED